MIINYVRGAAEGRVAPHLRVIEHKKTVCAARSIPTNLFDSPGFGTENALADTTH
jgi:hypothetical protein